MKKVLFFAVVAMSAMMVSCNKQAAQTEDKEVLEATEMSPEVAAIRVANDLAKHGYATESPLALIEAADILATTPTRAFGDSTKIDEGVKNPDAAANLLSYQMSDEGLVQVMGSALSLPAYTDLMADEAYCNTPPSAEPFINSAAYLGSDPQLEAAQTGKWSEYNSMIYSNLSDAFEGNVTLEEAAAAIDEQANSTLFNE